MTEQSKMMSTGTNKVVWEEGEEGYSLISTNTPVGGVGPASTLFEISFSRVADFRSLQL